MKVKAILLPASHQLNVMDLSDSFMFTKPHGELTELK